MYRATISRSRMQVPAQSSSRSTARLLACMGARVCHFVRDLAVARALTILPAVAEFLDAQGTHLFTLRKELFHLHTTFEGRTPDDRTLFTIKVSPGSAQERRQSTDVLLQTVELLVRYQIDCVRPFSLYDCLMLTFIRSTYTNPTTGQEEKLGTLSWLLRRPRDTSSYSLPSS